MPRPRGKDVVNGCHRKRGYSDRNGAVKAALRLMRRDGVAYMAVYQCRNCPKLHLTSNRKADRWWQTVAVLEAE